jgi:hypothetical protein
MKMRGLCLALLLAMAAARATAVGEVGATVKVGTLGLGAEASVGIAPRLNVRAGYNTLSYERDFTMDDADVTGELDWQTIPILLDWHAFGGGFRISAGGVINNNEVLISADPTEPFELQDAAYWIDSLDGKITFDSTSWYLGVGYGNAVDRDGRWHVSCDFGVMYHGEPKVEATAVAQDPLIQALLDQDLQKEVADFQDDIKAFVWYPVVSVGVSFRF